MKPDLCITIRFIQPFPLFHGRCDDEQPEWPPSPMRAFQALLNAASLRARGKPLAPEVRQALLVLEVLRPEVIAPRATVSAVGYRAYVPHNQTDLISAARYRGGDESSKAFRKLLGECRTEKDIRPMRIETIGDDLPTLHYLYPLEAATLDSDAMLRAIQPSARSITHLGWGIDQIIADATLIDRSSLKSTGERWLPSTQSGRRLRVHRNGSFDALTKRHDRFLNRLQTGWTPVPPLQNGTDMDLVRYRRDTDPLPHPFRLFELRNLDGSRFRYSHRKLIHIAGMVRHLAIEAMETAGLPRGVANDWIETYVAGHKRNESAEHRQLSYIPLPSVGHEHADPGVRRVMIVAPVGDDALLDYVARRLGGQQLKPVHGNEFEGEPPLLVPLPRSGDGVTRRYTATANVWHSFTPVILPGHDDRKPDKTRKLIEKALAQSGIEQPCEFEWSAFSRFPKSYSAHKYVRDENAKNGKRCIGYIRPDHLLNQTAVHLRLTFDHEVPGPLTIGAGRHCGFGLIAAVD